MQWLEKVTLPTDLRTLAFDQGQTSLVFTVPISAHRSWLSFHQSYFLPIESLLCSRWLRLAKIRIKFPFPRTVDLDVCDFSCLSLCVLFPKVQFFSVGQLSGGVHAELKLHTMQSDVFHRDQGAEIREWGISKKSVKIKRRIRTLEKRGAGKIDGFALGIFVCRTSPFCVYLVQVR